MKYKFVAAYCAYGMAIPPGQGNVTIFQNGAVHVFLTSDATDSLAIVDRQAAIGTVMLYRLLGIPVDGDPKEAWKPRVTEALGKRQQLYKSSGFVVIEVEGDIEVTLPDQREQIDDYWVCIDAYDKKKLAESIHPNVASALSAVRLSGETEYRFERVMSGSYLVDDQGLVVHSISFSGDGLPATISRVVSDDQIAAIRESIVLLRQTPELEQSIDLHVQSLNRQETKLRAFMAAWNALEQFVTEAKVKYGPLWDAERNNAQTQPDRISTLEGVSRNESKLAIAFGKIACYLWGQNTAADIDEFIALKRIRNSLSHELKDDELPIDRVHRLMDRYLNAHLKYG